MPPWLSDALCRAVTGEGLVRRALFTDDDLSVLFFRRVVAMNGVDLGIGRGDLADRMIVAELDRIADNARRLDADVTEQWTVAHPGVLGALLDLTANVLAALPTVELDRYPRMADYARVLAAVDRLTGTDGLTTYLGQRDQLSADLIAGDPLAAVVVAHIESVPFDNWTGTAGELLDALDRPHGVKSWPGSPRAMTAALARLAPALRAGGIGIERPPREGGTGGRLITLTPAPGTGRARANGEGSIFPYRNGHAAYVWVTTPRGDRKRKYVYGKTREAVHSKWLQLHAEARRGVVATTSPLLSQYLSYWLQEVVGPNLAPLTAATYETYCRLYIIPGLGAIRLDKLQVRDVQMWLNRVSKTCQCCEQGKDAARPIAAADPRKARRCCAIGKCCNQILSGRTVSDLRATLRSALSSALVEELVPRNVA